MWIMNINYINYIWILINIIILISNIYIIYIHILDIQIFRHSWIYFKFYRYNPNFAKRKFLITRISTSSRASSRTPVRKKKQRESAFVGTRVDTDPSIRDCPGKSFARLVKIRD